MSRLTFFQNIASNNVVDKTKYLIHLAYGADNIVDVHITGECSFKNPIFLLGSANFDFKHCNYVYFDEFARYYYIDNIVIRPNGIIELQCSVDVLMSFQKDIRSLYTIVERQEAISNCNPYIPDPNAIQRVDRQIVKKQIGSVGGNATGAHIALTVTGGV